MKLVKDDNYLQVLVRYINLNPVKHKITKKSDEWFYTSHHNYMGKIKYNLVDNDYFIDFKEYKSGLKNYVNYLKNIDEEL